MAERRETGGAKEFHYTKEESERIRLTDTSSTKAFKESYHSWNAKKEQKELERLRAEEQRLEQLRKNLIIGLITVIVMLALLMLLRFL